MAVSPGAVLGQDLIAGNRRRVEVQDQKIGMSLVKIGFGVKRSAVMTPGAGVIAQG